MLVHGAYAKLQLKQFLLQVIEYLHSEVLKDLQVSQPASSVAEKTTALKH